MSRLYTTMSSDENSTALHSARLLVVDDDEAIGNAVTKMLIGAGATVHTSRSATDALDYLDNNRIDAVITDLKMSGMDGFELMESVKEKDNTVSVVIMSSHASPETAIQATDLGASSYLRKPFKSDACVEAATKALEERSQKIGVPLRQDAPEISIE